MKDKLADSVRYEKFNVKIRKENKTSYISVLPPCRSVFWLPCLRANYDAGILKRSIVRNPERPENQNCQWTAERRIKWIKEMFPDEITEMLVSHEYDEEDINWGNCESVEEEF